VFSRIFKRKKPDNAERFLRLIDEGKYAEALPLGKEIISNNSAISANYFSYGLCLFELDRYAEAVDVFLKAYELDESDGGALHRACISLAMIGDDDRLYEIMVRECEKDSGMIDIFLSESLFSKYFAQARFKALIDRYKL